MTKKINSAFLATLLVFCLVAIISTANAKYSSVAVNSQTTMAQKLTEAKLKVCQNKEKAITKRDNQLTKLTYNMMTSFDKIATKVKTYYLDKVVPSGKTVSNYNTLIADIAAKKSNVQTAVDEAAADVASFTCTSDDPKGQLMQFRTDMQSVKQALKDYRNSIKSLIVAIRSVTAESASNSTTNQ